MLAYRGRLKQLQPVRALLEKVKEWCEPWHFGFMESREEKSLRLVLLVKQGLKGLRKALASIGTPKLPPEGWELLAKIDELDIFDYILDLDVLADGCLGDTVGVELILQKAVFPASQRELVQSPKFARLCELLQEAQIADQRLAALPNSIIAAPMSTGTDIYIYSRISHFKLRWRQGETMPAKVYVQLRPVQRQSCLNEALGYEKHALKGEAMRYE